MLPRCALFRSAWYGQVVAFFVPYALLTGFSTFFRSHLMVEFQFGNSTRRWLWMKPLKLTIKDDYDARTYGPIMLQE